VTKYDDFDYHAGMAEKFGQPVDHGFTHIGFMLAWLLRHGLGQPSFVGTDIAGRLTSDRLRPNDLRDLVDGKLISDALTTEGAAFLDAYYAGGYLREYELEFADLPDYAVPDSPDQQARADRVIDRAYDSWVERGRPPALSRGALWSSPASEAETSPGLDDLAGLVGAVEVHDLSKPHEDTVLETKIAAVIGLPIQTSSCVATTWGSSALNRTLRDLGVPKGDVIVANAMGTDGDPLLQVYKVPMVNSTDLATAFWPSSHDGRAGWQGLTINSVPAWASTVRPSRGEPAWTSVRCAVDGYAISISSSRGLAQAETLAAALIEALTRSPSQQ
jgi:hypothetical protein